MKQLLVAVSIFIAVTVVAMAGKIHEAVKSGSLEKVNSLLKSDSKLANARDTGGRTPLMLAAGMGDAKIVAALLARKADVSAVDKTNKSAMDYARAKNATDCIDLLFEALDPPNAHPSDDAKRDIEMIQDATRFKLAGLASAPQTPGIGKLEIGSDGRPIVRPPAWAGKFDEILSKARTAFYEKYGLDSKTANINSEGSLENIGTRSEGDQTLVYMDMGEWNDIITVTAPSTTFLPTILKSGLMTMKIPSMEVSFVQDAVCAVNGNRYVYRDGQWSAAANSASSATAGPAPSTETSRDSTTEKEYLNRGNAKQLSRDFDGAIAEYTKAIELDPKYAIAYCNRGAVKVQKGDLDGGIADFKKAIALKPDYTTAKENLDLAMKAKAAR